MPGFEERYEIGDPMCGVIDYAATNTQARQILTHCQDSHPRCDVYLYDRLAHNGHDDMWDQSGRVMHIKGE